MRLSHRLDRRPTSGVLSALLLSLGALLVSLTDATAQQRQLVDPRGVSIQPADLPRGFAVVEQETMLEQIRVGQTGTDADVIGVNFKTAFERPRTLEHLQSGPVRVSQIIARTDDPAKATFSLDAQREFNVRQHGYETLEGNAVCDQILCLIRRDGPFVEYRIVALKNGDTLVSTTSFGLSSAVNLDSAIALTRVSLSKYDELAGGVVAAQPQQVAAAGAPSSDVRAVATATPLSVSPPPPPPSSAPPAATPAPQSVVQETGAKLPPGFDQRLSQPWSELMSSSATTKSGEKLTTFFKRLVEENDLDVKVGTLRPNVGGELRSVVERDGDRMKIVKIEITVNKDVMNESPRVLAAMLAHEITHVSQPIARSGGNGPDCLEAEVEAYAVQARVWGAFWGQAHRPGQTKWERTMNYVEEVWKDGGEAGLRHLIRQQTDTDAHSCIG